MIFQCGANTTVRWIGNENGYAAKNTWSKSIVDVEADTCDDNRQGSYAIGYEYGNKWTVPGSRYTDHFRLVLGTEQEYAKEHYGSGRHVFQFGRA